MNPKSVNSGHVHENEMKCIDLIQAQLERARELLKTEESAEDVIMQISAIKFALKSMESTLVEKRMAARLSEAFNISNQHYQQRKLDKAELA